MNNEKQNDRQKLEALLKKVAVSQEFAPPEDALSKLIEEYSIPAKEAESPPGIDTTVAAEAGGSIEMAETAKTPADEEKAPKHSSNFEELLAFIKERKNKKTS